LKRKTITQKPYFKILKSENENDSDYGGTDYGDDEFSQDIKKSKC